MTVKELELRMDDYDSRVTSLETKMDKGFEKMQKAIENLAAIVDANNKGIKVFTEGDDHSETPDSSTTISERAKLPFPTFDRSNYRVWKAKAKQFFELKTTPVDQRSRLLLLSMDGKAFAWQRSYMLQDNFKHKTWQEVLRDVGLRFDDGAYDDPVAEISKL